MKNKSIIGILLMILFFISGSFFALSSGEMNERTLIKSTKKLKFIKHQESKDWELVSTINTKNYNKNPNYRLRSKSNVDLVKNNLHKFNYIVTNSELEIEFNGNKIQLIRMYDLLGNVYFGKDRDFDNENIIINFDKLQGGFYIVNVVTKEHFNESKKFVINK